MRFCDLVFNKNKHYHIYLKGRLVAEYKYDILRTMLDIKEEDLQYKKIVFNEEDDFLGISTEIVLE